MSLIVKPTSFQNGQTADATQVNANFDAIFNDYNGNITDSNIASSGISTFGKVQGSAIANLGSISASAGSLPLTAFQFPIGFVITLGVATNPATLLGYGTWTAIAGRVIVGIDAGQTEFDTLNETGGAKTVTLTGAQSGTSAHTHTVGITSGGEATSYVAAQSVMGATAAIGGQKSYNSTTTATDASEAHDNLQPYIVKYVWERTA